MYYHLKTCIEIGSKNWPRFKGSYRYQGEILGKWIKILIHLYKMRLVKNKFRNKTVLTNCISFSLKINKSLIHPLDEPV